MPAAWVAAAGALIGGVSSMQDSGGGGGTGYTMTENLPWSGQRDYLARLFNAARNQYETQPALPYYPGKTTADQSPYTQAAISGLANTALDKGSLTNASLDAFKKTARGDYLDPSTNPALAGAVADALGQVKSNVSGLYGSHGGNNYGSSAHEEYLTRMLANTALPMYAQNYQQERGRQMQAAQLGPQQEAQAYGGLTQAGNLTDTYQQSLLDADKAKFDYEQTSPWETLQRYQNSISGQYGNAQTQPYFKPNPYLNALGGAATGLGMYNQYQQANKGSTNNSGYDWGQSYSSTGQYNPPYTGYDSSGGPAYG